jgi:hypothetical protein
MARKRGHQCGFAACREGLERPTIDEHRQLNALLDRLDEQQRRWVAGRESMQLGYGGVKQIAEITGLHHETIRRGRDELQNDLADRPTDRIRCKGGGRPRVEKKIPR